MFLSVGVHSRYLLGKPFWVLLSYCFSLVLWIFCICFCASAIHVEKPCAASFVFCSSWTFFCASATKFENAFMDLSSGFSSRLDPWTLLLSVWIFCICFCASAIQVEKPCAASLVFCSSWTFFCASATKLENAFMDLSSGFSRRLDPWTLLPSVWIFCICFCASAIHVEKPCAASLVFCSSWTFFCASA